MGSEWAKGCLGDIAEVVMGQSPKGSDCNELSEGVPLLNGPTEFGSSHPIPTQFTTDPKKLAIAGDLLFCVRGSTTGRMNWSDQQYAIGRGLAAIRHKRGVALQPLLRSIVEESLPILLQGATGSTFPNVSRNQLLELEVLIPPDDVAERISDIRQFLDNKIALNRQINTTLESMAQALFKSWFVDFDPVIDNALDAGNEIPDALQKRAAARAARREALRQQTSKTTATTDAANSEQALPDTGLSDQRLPTEIQQLFPDRFVFTEEMGWVPEGWELRSIGDMFYLLGGHPFKSSEYVDDGEYGVVTIKNVQDSKFIESCSNFMTKIPAKMKRHCFLERGDVLLSLTGNVGRVCLVSPGKYLLNQRVAKLVGKDGLSNAFAYFFFKQSRIFEAMLTIAKGTAQQNLSPIETAKLTQLLPDSSVIRECQKYFESEYLRLISCTAESQTLANLRDSLLPKLLSGQITIPDAEQQLAEVL